MPPSSSSLGASVNVEYEDDPDVILTETEREKLCEYWNCKRHTYNGEELCPIKKTEKKVVQKMEQIS